MGVDNQIGAPKGVGSQKWLQQVLPDAYDADPVVQQQKQAAQHEAQLAVLANAQQSYAAGGGANSYSSGSSSGGGSRRGGGGGGGGGSGVNQMYIDAMKAYLAKKQAGLQTYLAPYGDAQAGITSAADQARASIGNMGAYQDQRLAQSNQLQQQYNDQLRQAYTQNPAQYNYGGLQTDLQAQGAGTGGLALQAQLAAAAQQQDAQRRSQLADSLIATRNSDLSQRGDISHQLTTGMQGQLDLNKLAYLAQNTKAKAAATQTYNDQLDQLLLQMAQQGITP
jgi:hypothetical protein